MSLHTVLEQARYSWLIKYNRLVCSVFLVYRWDKDYCQHWSRNSDADSCVTVIGLWCLLLRAMWDYLCNASRCETEERKKHTWWTGSVWRIWLIRFFVWLSGVWEWEVMIHHEIRFLKSLKAPNGWKNGSLCAPPFRLNYECWSYLWERQVDTRVGRKVVLYTRMVIFHPFDSLRWE